MATMTFESEMIALIKQKRELKTLDDEVVLEALQSVGYYVEEKYDTFEKFSRSKHCKDVISLVRKKLRDMYGLFIVKHLSTKDIDSLESIDASSLFEKHLSTAERAPYYDTIYPMLHEELVKWGLPRDYSLIDIACGNNPLAVSFLPKQPKMYVGRDLSSKDMGILSHFYQKFGLGGDMKAANVLGTSFKAYLKESSFDVAFLFKALDPLEQIKRHSSKQLLLTLQAPLLVVSFSLFSIGGKTPIPASKRSWFEKFCKKQNWEYKTLQVPNELFYLIRKNS